MSSITADTERSLPIDQLLFIQSTVKREAVDAKKLIYHLSMSQGPRWREYLPYFLPRLRTEFSPRVLELMGKLELTLPLPVHPFDNKPDRFMAIDGTHTVYALAELGFTSIRSIILSPSHDYSEPHAFLSLAGLRVESD